jgi:hypothetical protein
MKKLLFISLLLLAFACSKDDEVAYCYRCDSYANNTLGTSGETEELCKGQGLTRQDIDNYVDAVRSYGGNCTKI